MTAAPEPRPNTHRPIVASIAYALYKQQGMLWLWIQEGRGGSDHQLTPEGADYLWSVGIRPLGFSLYH